MLNTGYGKKSLPPKFNDTFNTISENNNNIKNYVLSNNEDPINVSENPSSVKKLDPVCIPNVFNKLLVMFIWLTWFEYSMTADSNAL